jgi:hypothetical protein
MAPSNGRTRLGAVRRSKAEAGWTNHWLRAGVGSEDVIRAGFGCLAGVASAIVPVGPAAVYSTRIWRCY